MRRPWIKVETATPDKPEICAIATSLRLDEDSVLGKLVRLWSWVEVNRVSANDLGVTKEFLDKLVGRKGFAAALVACGWLVEVDEKLGLKNLERHNGGLAKVRALTAQRVALHRKRKLQGVAKALQSETEDGDTDEKVTASVSLSESVQNKDETLKGSVLNDDVHTESHEVNVTHEEDPLNDEVRPHVATQSDASTLGTETEAGLAAKESAAQKRRQRASNESPDQPMLF